MEIKLCKNGHYYCADLNPECPECAMQNKLEGLFELDDAEPTTAAIAKCNAGHYYNALLQRCPVCFHDNPPVMILEKQVTCVNGHKYDRSASLSCPQCGASQQTHPRKFHTNKGLREEFADMEASPETLLFTAYHSLSYWLRRENGTIRLSARSLVTHSGPILESTVEISMEAALGTARKILNILGGLPFLPESPSKTGESRFLFNTRQLSCDHRWKYVPSLHYSPIDDTMRRIYEVLGELYAQHSRERNLTPPVEWKLLAQLDYSNIDLQLYQESGHYHLVAQVLIYYHFVSSISLRETASIPADRAQELLTWLRDCGAMEALIEKSKRPDDCICRDPAEATVFRLEKGGLSFSYRDWDKENGFQESLCLGNAQRKMLELFQEFQGPNAK